MLWFYLNSLSSFELMDPITIFAGGDVDAETCIVATTGNESSPLPQ